MEVPGFVHFPGRGDRVIGRHRQKHKALVFANDPIGEIEGPLILPSQPLGKGKLDFLAVDIKGLNRLPKCVLFRCHEVVSQA